MTQRRRFARFIADCESMGCTVHPALGGRGFEASILLVRDSPRVNRVRSRRYCYDVKRGPEIVESFRGLIADESRLGFVVCPLHLDTPDYMVRDWIAEHLADGARNYEDGKPGK